jgi:hypothetical protein
MQPKKKEEERMRVLLTLLFSVAIVALATAGTAAAGGFATVGLNTMPPDGGGPGSTWDVTLNVLQHGVTPLSGVSPMIVIRNVDTGETQTFPATPTGEPGKYAAKVVFPSAGTWDYEINDGFSQTHTFKPIVIGDGAPVAGAGDGDGYSMPWAIAGAAAIVLAFAAMFLFARRPARPVATH